MYGLNLIITGYFTKPITLRIVGVWSSVLSDRHAARLVLFLQRPLYGPDAQRPHVGEGAEVAISNNCLRSLKTHTQSLKTRVVNAAGRFEALFDQTL